MDLSFSDSGGDSTFDSSLFTAGTDFGGLQTDELGNPITDSSGAPLSWGNQNFPTANASDQTFPGSSSGSAITPDMLSRLLSGGSGLFDLFSKSPLSMQGINNAAATAADPLMGDRPAYGGIMRGLMTNPSSFNMSPGAQFVMKQGTENLTRSDAAKGLLGSGNILGDIMKFGEGVASEDYYKMIDRLSALSGGATGSPAVAGQIISGLYNQRNNATANVGAAMVPPAQQSSDGGGGIGSILGGIASIAGLF